VDLPTAGPGTDYTFVLDNGEPLPDPPFVMAASWGWGYDRIDLQIVSQSTVLPRTREELQGLLDIYLIEKAGYELSYELNNRPGWIRIPLQGISELVEVTG